MIKNENIICISSIDWDFIWQGHQEIMSVFAASGNRVLFIENTGIRPPSFKDFSRIRKRIINWLKSVKGFRKEKENIYIYSPLILPFPYSRIARWVNKYLMLIPLKRWLDIMKFDNPIVWTFLPTGIALDIIHSLRKKALIYYYIADFNQLTRNRNRLKKTEEQLMRECDVIFVQGEYFKKRCLKFNKNVFIFPFGVNGDIFSEFQEKMEHAIPEDMRAIPRPIIGYIGGIHRHLDFGLLRFMAENNPNWSIVLIGPLQTQVSGIKNFKNIYFLNQKDFLRLPQYISQFDVGIVPYLLSEYTNTVYPTKINEYHIMGKPVVSTALPEVIGANRRNLIRVAKDYKEFASFIKDAINEDKSMFLAERVAAARDNSWPNRIEEMSQKVEELIRTKALAPLRWQAHFLEAYRVSRNKAVKTVCVFGFVWFLIFYTPLIWFLAEPLRTMHAPGPSDAIVAFAGGVGESGRPGQGYEERVKRSIELYNAGFAKRIIFSSGDKNVYPESYLMKTLAFSLGVPESAIVIENKAANTYENVKFTAKILDAMGCRKIILVSSPYHARRALLVFRKIAPEKEVVFTPCDSLFYYRDNTAKRGIDRLKQINLRQIGAIFHEYLAILYYFIKGYI